MNEMWDDRVSEYTTQIPYQLLDSIKNGLGFVKKTKIFVKREEEQDEDFVRIEVRGVRASSGRSQVKN